MTFKRGLYLTLFITLLFSFLSYQIVQYDIDPDFSLRSIFSEGMITLMALLSLIAIQWIEGSNKLYYLLTSAISLLVVSFASDTLDDIVQVNSSFSFLFEDAFQLIGYILMTLGIILWVRQTHKLMKRLVVMAHTDKLTGAYNRHKLNDIFEQESRIAERYHLPLSLILFDLDNFKKINDTYGHATGDHVLTATSALIQKEKRDCDHFARIGGEEFVVLHPGTDIERAETAAEKFRKAIDSFEFEEVQHASASFGVTSCQPGDNLESMLHRADLALYKAKENGRNCVITSNDNTEEL